MQEMINDARETELMDKVMVQLKKGNVVLSEFREFPKMTLGPAGILFEHYSKHSASLDVNKTRQEYYAQRLAIAEMRVFSHVDKYIRAKLKYSDDEVENKTVVHHVHSVLGSN